MFSDVYVNNRCESLRINYYFMLHINSRFTTMYMQISDMAMGRMYGECEQSIRLTRLYVSIFLPRCNCISFIAVLPRPRSLLRGWRVNSSTAYGSDSWELRRSAFLIRVYVNVWQFPHHHPCLINFELDFRLFGAFFLTQNFTCAVMPDSNMHCRV